MIRRRRFPQAKASSGRRPRRIAGEMNRTERRYHDEVLVPSLAAGAIAAFWFEEWTFKLGKDLRYTPDFVILFPDGRLCVREVKARDKRTGRWRGEDDAKVKMKVFAELFPMQMGVVWSRGLGAAWELDVLSTPFTLEDALDVR